MRSSFDKIVTQRRYKRFFRSVSEVGGFADLIMYELYLVYFFYNSWSYQKWIREKLIQHFLDLDSEKKSPKKSTNSSKTWPKSSRAGLKDSKFRRAQSSKKCQTQDNNKIVYIHLFERLNKVEVLMKLNPKSKILLELIFRRIYYHSVLNHLVLSEKRKEK